MAGKKLTKDYRDGWRDGSDEDGLRMWYDEPTDEYRRGYDAGRAALNRAEKDDARCPWEEERRNKQWGMLDGVWRRPPSSRLSDIPAYMAEYHHGLTLPAEPDPVVELNRRIAADRLLRQAQ